ncbi:MAG: succinylglutamate desuccinylase/aspartoacylase family protein [Candidatus Nanohaloarchaeota archaeon QJJ-5]|nr:succinylglutamate desuccinylase/aspartoacylase family protein [Candidatus Nanohaloarchaeota archaeon QJJ-5]
METIQHGDGDPALSIVACLHGDEKAGRAIITQLDDHSFSKPVQFVIANQRAMEQDQRYIDTDLNRAFPGDPDADTHEDQLAASILDTVAGTTVIDLHTTPSTGTACCVIAGTDPTTERLCHGSGLEHVIDIGYESGGLIQHVTGISIECGRRGTKKAIEQGTKTVRNLLRAEGYLDGPAEHTDPACFQITGEIDRIEDPDVHVTDFTQVEPGETIASNETVSLNANTSFYPVLTATDGYEQRLGYRAQHRGRLSAYKTLQDEGEDHA